jgi:hypothetical protein
VRDDPPGVGVRRRTGRIARRGSTGERVKAQDRAVEPGGVGRRAHVLGTQRPALRGGPPFAPPTAPQSSFHTGATRPGGASYV